MAQLESSAGDPEAFIISWQSPWAVTWSHTFNVKSPELHQSSTRRKLASGLTHTRTDNTFIAVLWDLCVPRCATLDPTTSVAYVSVKLAKGTLTVY